MLRSATPTIVSVLAAALALWGAAPAFPASRDAPRAGPGELRTPDGVRLAYVFHPGPAEGGGTPLIVPNAFHLEEPFRVLAEDRPVVFYDMRARGRSERITDPARLGVPFEVKDLEAVRRHFGWPRVDLLGHSYLGLVAALYAAEHPRRVERVVQIGPLAPTSEIPTEPDTSMLDAEEWAAVQEELAEGGSEEDPEGFYERFWSAFMPFMVGDPADAARVPLPEPVENEYIHNMFATIGALLGPLGEWDYRDRARRIAAPTLVVHGTEDRNASYESGRAWAAAIPEARLLTVRGAAHLPYVEEPDLVLPAVRRFLAGEWPQGAERIETVRAPHAPPPPSDGGETEEPGGPSN